MITAALVCLALATFGTGPGAATAEHLAVGFAFSATTLAVVKDAPVKRPRTGRTPPAGVPISATEKALQRARTGPTEPDSPSE